MASRRLTPIPEHIGRPGAEPWDEAMIARLRQEGEQISRQLQQQVREMRTLSVDDLKVRSR